jgi:hypothetical protein
MLGMSSSLLTLAAGGLGGVTVKAVVDIFSQKRLWRREDRHRFASTKQELYARFPSLVSALEEARNPRRQAQDELSAAEATPLEQRNSEKLMELAGLAVSAGRAEIDALHVVIQAADAIELIGGSGVRLVVGQIATVVKNDGTDLDTLIPAVLKAARADLRVPADLTEATARHRRWKVPWKP